MDSFNRRSSKGAWLVGLDLFSEDTRPSGHISRPTQVNVPQSCFHSLNNYSSLIILYTSGGQLKLINYIISDRRTPFLAGIPLCKSQELSRREHSTSRLCSIHHDIPVTMHTPAAYGQASVSDHNGDNLSAVLGTRYGIWWPWYGQFEVEWLQPLHLWLGAGTSSVSPLLVSKHRYLCHVQLHPTWFEPTSECRKELRWPLCTGWTLGWCRMIPMPVSIPSYGYCPVVLDQWLTLCHIQCNHSPAWNVQWPGTASEVCLCLLPTSNQQPLGWGWERPCTASWPNWYASWMRGVSPTTARGASLTPPLAEECCQTWLQGISWSLDQGAVKCMTALVGCTL